MKKISVLLVSAVLLASCGGGEPTTPTNLDPAVPPEERPLPDGYLQGPVFDVVATLQVSDGATGRVVLRVSGSLPDPCHEPYWSIDDDGRTLDVTLVSGVAPDTGACIQVIAPFSVEIELGTWVSQGRAVVLNGEEVGSF
ncbi:MAG: hypothetical protein KatS3mg011_0797 [Acidimicrobiia bacterium]|nr:MAG: hypothetical protein KatS3mg011_0797 [Acidimicrobiia bacterium]